jgi:TetR/AcrR family transcriptional regulator
MTTLEHSGTTGVAPPNVAARDGAPPGLAVAPAGLAPTDAVPPHTAPADAAPPEVAPAEQDEQTRARLLRAGVCVFDRKGYAAASVREIVENAGVTKPALYYHFGSKEGLLTAVLAEAAREFTRAMERGVRRPGTARERLFAICADLHGLFREHVPVVRVAHSVFFGPVEGAPQFDFTTFDRDMERTVREIVADGQAAGEIASSASPADIALVILGIIGVFATRHMHNGLEALDLDSMKRVLGLIFDGALGRQQGEPRS